MNATTGSGAAGSGSVLGVNSGGEFGFGVLVMAQHNTVGPVTRPSSAKTHIAPGGWRRAATGGYRTRRMQATIGFRVKSGWAAAALLAGPAAEPRVIDHRVVQLSDPAVPTARQPYHAGRGVAQPEPAMLQRLIAGVHRYAAASIAKRMAECRAAGYEVGGTGVVIGSEVDQRHIVNPHIRVHAAEGLLFRTVVEEATRSCGLTSTIFVERELFAHAAAILGRSEVSLKQDLAHLGRTLSPPWRQEQKSAAAAAWMVLASVAV